MCIRDSRSHPGADGLGRGSAPRLLGAGACWRPRGDNVGAISLPRGARRGPPPPTEGSRHLGAQLQRALVGLARGGVPPGFRWSRVLSPLIWLSFPRYRETVLRE
eukprot:9550393-Alexandrium_andersonii.AAC.1